MTCRDDVGTTGPDKSESKRYLLVPNCFLGSSYYFFNSNYCLLLLLFYKLINQSKINFLCRWQSCLDTGMSLWLSPQYYVSIMLKIN